MTRPEHKSLLIKGGHLIDPAAKINAPMDLLLRDGRVAEVAPPNKIRGGADEKFDAKGLIVAPGFIDLHDLEYGVPHIGLFLASTQVRASAFRD